MAEVHEISRTALKQLIDAEKVCDWKDGYGDYAVVCCAASFAHTPAIIDLQDYFESEYWATRSAENRQYITLDATARCHGYCCHYYEVWHIVDDADYVAKKLESLRQLREAGALDGVLSQDSILASKESSQGTESYIDNRIDSFKREIRDVKYPKWQNLSHRIDYVISVYEKYNDTLNEETYDAGIGEINSDNIDDAIEQASYLISYNGYSKIEIGVWLHDFKSLNYLSLYKITKRMGEKYALAMEGNQVLDLCVKDIPGTTLEFDYIPF